MNQKKMLKGKLNGKQIEIAIMLGVVAMSLFLYKEFIVSGSFQKIVATISFLLVIPVLYVKLVLKRSLKEFGIKKGDWKKGVAYSVPTLIVLAAVFYQLFDRFDFLNKYFMSVHSVSSFKYFVFREIVQVGFFVAIYEFFFRGFIMFYFSDKIKSGIYLVAFQSLIFYLFLWIAGSFGWSTLLYIILAPLAGLVAYSSKSILYSFVFSWLSVLVVDTIFIKLFINSVLGK